MTGFNITNAGTGYVAPVIALVAFSGGATGGYPTASGTALVGGASSGITGITWLTSGYYTGTTGNYVVSFVSALGIRASGKPVFAPAYVKTFTGQHQFFTGLFSSGTSGTATAMGSTYFSGNSTLGTGDILAFMRVSYLGTADTANFLYKIRASGLTDTFSGITIYSGSGLSFRV